MSEEVELSKEVRMRMTVEDNDTEETGFKLGSISIYWWNCN